MQTEIFKYPDTNASRAGIEPLTAKLANQNIAIIGLGGTGSYILDLVSKTPVKEIHLFDADNFFLHNAFRSPGAIANEELREGMKKVEYLRSKYSNMHNGIVAHAKFVSREDIIEFEKFDFVFISIDKNASRKEISDELIHMKIPFIDVGLGINMNGDKLGGALRVTTSTPDQCDHVSNWIGGEEGHENVYSSNIQLAELNCLNAALAVIKWKKLSEFYQDLKREHNQLYFIDTNKVINEVFAASVY